MVQKRPPEPDLLTRGWPDLKESRHGKGLPDTLHRIRPKSGTEFEGYQARSESSRRSPSANLALVGSLAWDEAESVNSVAKKRNTASRSHASWSFGPNGRSGLDTLLLQPQPRQGNILPFMPVVVGGDTLISGQDVGSRSSQAHKRYRPLQRWSSPYKVAVFFVLPSFNQRRVQARTQSHQLNLHSARLVNSHSQSLDFSSHKAHGKG